MPHADGASETISRTSAPKRTRVQQTCNTQMAKPSAERRCKPSPQTDLPLVIRDNQGHFTADPQSVAEHYAKAWKREWRDEDTISFDKETSSIRDLRDKHVADTHEWARNLDLSAASVHKACLSFPSKTAIGLDQHAFKDIALHLLIPQLVARGYPLEILVLGTLTQKSPRRLQVGNSYSNIIMGCASSMLAGCLQSCSWARGLLFEFVRGPWFGLRRAHRQSVTFCCEQEPYATFPRCGEDRQRSKSRHDRVGLDPIMQINASGKLQIPGEIHRQSSWD